MWIQATLVVSFGVAALHVSGQYIRDWNARKPTPISELALVEGREFTFKNFDPPLQVRGDGAPFISVALVDSAIWINLALNSLASMARFHGVNGVTVMVEEEDGKLEQFFKRIGFYVYNADSIISTFPPEFGKDTRIPNWSWGEIIFLRYNLWFEAFRRGVGFCSLDLDVAYNKDVFFNKVDGKYVDISMQGQLMTRQPRQASNECVFALAQHYTNKMGYYVNPGLACHAHNNNTFAMMQDMQKHIKHSINVKMGGWGQPAYVRTFCENDFEYSSPKADQTQWQWSGVLKKHNISVSMFKAVAPTDGRVSAKRKKQVPSYHAKACHGVGEKGIGDPDFRVRCKEDWLKQQGQWFLPPNVPMTLEGWLNMDEALLAQLQALLFSTPQKVVPDAQAADFFAAIVHPTFVMLCLLVVLSLILYKYRTLLLLTFRSRR